MSPPELVAENWTVELVPGLIGPVQVRTVAVEPALDNLKV